MTWSVTISGHIGSRETEKVVVDSLRSLIRNLNSDGSTFASEAVVTTSYGGRIDLMKADEETFHYAEPIKATEELTGRLDTEKVEGTDKVMAGTEVFETPDPDDDDENANLVSEKEDDDLDDEPESVHATSVNVPDNQPPSKSVKSLDELTGKTPAKSAKTSPLKAATPHKR